MSIGAKALGSRQGSYDPATSDLLYDRRAGPRRTFDRRPSLLWRFTKTYPRQSFSDWKKIAARILHQHGVSFRLVSTFEELMFWKERAITATDAVFAARGGGCSTKTISRELRQYEALGLIQVERNWRRRKDGKIVRTRTLRLALPMNLDLPTFEFIDDEDTDHCGPDPSNA